MEFTSFTAGSDDNGKRLDRILKRILPDFSLSGLYQSLRRGTIKLNGKKVEGSAKVLCNDIITIASFLLLKQDVSHSKKDNPPESIPQEHPGNCPKMLPLQTIFRNEYVWIINKPYGIPVQPDNTTRNRTAACLSDIVAAEYATMHREESLSFRPGPLHRLDKNTTGLLAFSQNSEGAHWFTAALAEESGNASFEEAAGLLRKTYVGIVQGDMHSPARWKDFVLEQPALTQAQPLAHGIFLQKQITLVQFDIFTGRKHQIRRQSASHGFPLLGDTLYGGTGIPPSSHAGRSFFLHAMHLSIAKDNPIGLPEELTAPVTEDFEKFLAAASLINWDGRLILTKTPGEK